MSGTLTEGSTTQLPEVLPYSPVSALHYLGTSTTLTDGRTALPRRLRHTHR